MATLPPATKLRVYLLACAAWVAACAWLVGCVAFAAPLRMGASAALAVALLAWAVWFIRHDMELDLLRARADVPVHAPDDDWEKGEA